MQFPPNRAWSLVKRRGRVAFPWLRAQSSPANLCESGPGFPRRSRQPYGTCLQYYSRRPLHSKGAISDLRGAGRPLLHAAEWLEPLPKRGTRGFRVSRLHHQPPASGDETWLAGPVLASSTPSRRGPGTPSPRGRTPNRLGWASPRTRRHRGPISAPVFQGKCDGTLTLPSNGGCRPLPRPLLSHGRQTAAQRDLQGLG